MKSANPTQRRFLFLLSVLAALLAVCLLIIVKAMVDHAAFRNALGTVSLVLFGPLLWFVIEAIVDTALDFGLGQIKMRLPRWVYRITIAILFIGSTLLMADDFLGIGWFW